MSAFTKFDDESIKEEVIKNGFTPVAVVHLPHWFVGGYFVMCYVVHVEENIHPFIVRGDTGEILDSGEFWEKFGPAATVLSGPFIIVKYEL